MSRRAPRHGQHTPEAATGPECAGMPAVAPGAPGGDGTRVEAGSNRVCPVCLQRVGAATMCPRCGSPTPARPSNPAGRGADRTGGAGLRTSPPVGRAGSPPPPTTLDLLLGPAFRPVPSGGSIAVPPGMPAGGRRAPTPHRYRQDTILDAAEVLRAAADLAPPASERRPHTGPGGPRPLTTPPPRVRRRGTRPPTSGGRSFHLPSGTVGAVAASIAVGACFAAGALLASTPGGQHGSGPGGGAEPAGGAASRPAPVAAGIGLVPVAPSSQFTASGQGPASTLSFHIDARWTLRYQVSCPGNSLATASFSVVTATATVAGIDTSVVGTASGSRSGLPPVTVAVAVAVAPACTWQVEAAASQPGA